MIEQQKHRENGIGSGWLLPVIIVVLLGALTMLLLTARQDFRWSLFMPYWNDEVVHWHQAATFSAVGFNGGYYTINEMPAPLPFVHFYAWGAALPMLYGTVMRVFGTSFLTFPLIHAVGYALALLLFIKLAHLNRRQMLLTGVFAALFFPYQLYFPMSMQEGLQMTLAVIAAAACVVILRTEPGTLQRRRAVLVMVVMIVIFAQTRATWALFLIPLLALTMPLRFALILGGIGTVALIFLTQLFAAPSATAITDALSVFRSDPIAAMRILASHTRENVKNFWGGHTLEWLIRFQVIALFIDSGLHLRKRETDRFSFFVLFLFIVFLFLVWYVGYWRDYRHLAPILLFGTMLLIAWRRYRMVLVLMTAGVITLLVPASLEQYEMWMSYRLNPGKEPAYLEWQGQLSEVIHYQPDAPSAWCNTVLMSLKYLNTEAALAIEPGIGLSYLMDTMKPIEGTPRSRYLLLGSGEPALHPEALNVERLLDVMDGALYLNHDADC